MKNCELCQEKNDQFFERKIKAWLTLKGFSIKPRNGSTLQILPVDVDKDPGCGKEIDKC